MKVLIAMHSSARRAHHYSADSLVINQMLINIGTLLVVVFYIDMTKMSPSFALLFNFDP